MRVLLVHTNQERAPQPVMPLGLCSLAGALEAAGFSPRLLDLCFSRRPLDDVRRAIGEWKPGAIGLSVRNLDSGDFLNPRRYLPLAEEIADACRRASPAPLVIGGPAVSIAPEQLLDRLGADYAVVGDGEQAFVELLSRMRDGTEVGGIPGILARSGEAPVHLHPAHVPDLQVLAAPQLSRWIDVRRYARNGGFVPVQSKRGCGFRCVYCTYRVIEGARYRLRPPDAVADEIEQAVRDWGARRFEFVDSTFNHPEAHAHAVCRSIERRRLGVTLHTTGLNPAAASAELLLAMRQAGFRSVVCSPDSASEEILRRLQRGFGVAQIEQTARWARAAGISVLWGLLFGGPGETEATVRETLAFIERELSPQDRVLCTTGLRVYAGTELEGIARDEEVLTRDCDLTEPVFYFSPQITPERVLELLDASSRRSQMVHLGALQTPFVSLALRAHSLLRVPGQSWAAVPAYNALRRVLRPRAGGR